jgi:phosphatidylglycerophosphate synthase
MALATEVNVRAELPTVRDFYRTNRGGGLVSEGVHQWGGALLARLGYRHGTAPTTLTLTNLFLGLSASIAVIALARPASDGDVPGWLPGVIALIGWHLAYCLDCADGQLARVSGRQSAAGGRVDVLCDVAAQIGLVTAVSSVMLAQRGDTPLWLVALFAGSWMINLITSVMQAGPAAASMVTSRSLPVRLVKLVRDYGAVIALFAIVLIAAPKWTVIPVLFFTAVNTLFLFASIAFSARTALRATPR